MFWKEFFYYTKSERRAVTFCFAIAVAMVIAYIAFGIAKSNEEYDKETDSLQIADIREWLEGIEQMDSIRRYRYESHNGRETRLKTLQPFNPNSADSAMLVSLGLQPWMARNILRYRERGGKFRVADDFAKVYGLSEEQFEELRPYITIPEEEVVRVYDEIPIFIERRDTVFKYPEGTLLPINMSDTTELKKIPGVGSGIARMIVGYRNRIGGFYSVEQLADINLNVDILRHWLVEDSVPMRLIRINHSSIDYMKSHPYINYRQAKAIYEYRRRRGDIRDISVLRMMEEFTDRDIERISHYVSYN